MRRPPEITVQLIHIHGPMKGEIKEFSKESITIGRHPSSDLKLPAELTVISRNHAEIKRVGNQFRLIDRSTNGTFVNGKKISEVLLRDGDVLEFADGGPKVSFLTQAKETAAEVEAPSPEPAREASPSIAPPVPEPAQDIAVQPSVAPLVIQYGPTIRSYKELPVTIGKGAKCQFPLDHPGIYDQHAQVFFTRGQYWIKDLTGQNAVRINQRPIGLQSALTLYDNVALGPQGPVFRFLGDGRMAEVQEAAAEQSPAPVKRDESKSAGATSDAKPDKGVLSKIKKKLF